MPYPTVQETQETSVPTTTNFLLTLVGQIELVDNANQLVLSDGTRFPVAKTKLDLPPQPQAYRVTPSITSTGAITNLSIDSYTSPELEDSPGDRLNFRTGTGVLSPRLVPSTYRLTPTPGVAVSW